MWRTILGVFFILISFILIILLIYWHSTKKFIFKDYIPPPIEGGYYPNGTQIIPLTAAEIEQRQKCVKTGFC